MASAEKKPAAADDKTKAEKEKEIKDLLPEEELVSIQPILTT